MSSLSWRSRWTPSRAASAPSQPGGDMCPHRPMGLMPTLATWAGCVVQNACRSLRHQDAAPASHLHECVAQAQPSQGGSAGSNPVGGTTSDLHKCRSEPRRVPIRARDCSAGRYRLDEAVASLRVCPGIALALPAGTGVTCENNGPGTPLRQGGAMSSTWLYASESESVQNTCRNSHAQSELAPRSRSGCEISALAE